MSSVAISLSKPALDHIERPESGHDETNTSPGEGSEILPPGGGHGMTFRVFLAIFSLASIYMPALSTFVSIAPIISTINNDIGPVSTYTWMATSWTISGAISVAVCGSASDLVGRRWVAVGSGVLGMVGAAIGGSANHVPQVIVGMTIIGIAAGGCQNSFPAICELVPTRSRGKVLAIVNSVTSLWSVFGSLFAYHMASNYGWRSVFYVSIALHGLGSVLCFLFYRPADPLALGEKKRTQILREFDWVGLAGLMAGPTLLLLGISWLGSGYSARDAHFIAPLVTGFATCIALGFHQAYIAKQPILHPFLFKRFRSFTIVLVLIFVGGMLYYSLQSLYPLYVQLVFTGPDPTQIGLWSISLGAGATVGGVGAGFLVTLIKNTRWMLVGGVALMAIFIAMMAKPGPDDKEMALAFSFFGGVGIGWEQTLGILVVQLACPDEWIGFATGILGLFRICGGAAGTAIYSTVFSTQVKKHLSKMVAQSSLQAGLPADSLQEFLATFLGPHPATAAELPGVNPVILAAAESAAKHAYAKSFRLVWLVTIPFAVAGMVAALLCKDQSHKLVDKTAMSLKIDQQRERSDEEK